MTSSSSGDSDSSSPLNSSEEDECAPTTSHRTFLCPSCPKSFKTKSNLNQHLRTHMPQKFICESCGRILFSESGLRYHRLSSHSGEGGTSFPCSLCSSSFLQNKLLQKHLNSVHSYIKNYPCPYCEASFKRKDNADRHVRDTHSLVGKLWECEFCSSKFMSSARLSQHRRLHNSEGTSWICSLCGKSFLRQKNLRLHSLKKHSESSLKCLSCDFDFLFPSELASHLKYYPEHNLNPEDDFLFSV
ncbi:KRAB [Lepeophtheirus salmonis]|uniref:KRAB n=1 Tax=Lepeophtheirus salmonis TaxID=72036 RepID=A0A7R8CDN5_LEPSM|nr:KRAB [Lepeophtheirus salmonis]CAF2781557.1 KRAB [Lepeophtheirus salmonis]